ncbi:MAG: GntG family PLP-dependent aldolase [Chitinophagales bacterium]|nr:GntG family PLP-dependent aldolase [Chitinophagales bacterium]
MIDLRSDTVTRPTPAMRQAMLEAAVGDDVFGEDPSVNALEEKMASMFGMEAAIFCPSGTMTNQIAIKLHTQPGDEVICHRLSHVYNYEGGGIAFNSGASVRLIEGNTGFITAEEIKENFNNPNDPHKPLTSLVCLENTANRAGGLVFSLEQIRPVAAACKELGLALHLDGARLFNALVVTQDTPAAYGATFHTISICLSKGLGAPVGSVLLGTKEYIRKARRIRKVFGGGMRQAGSLAAAGIYALDHHIERLKEDHEKAQAIKRTLEQCSWVKHMQPVASNIVIFHYDTAKFNGKGLDEVLKAHEILAISLAPGQLRFVTHLDISDAMMEKIENTLMLL